MGPMLLKPAVKNYLWGGTRLKEEYGKECGSGPLAETWECSTHPEGPSTVVNGEFAGKRLDAVLREHPECLGTRYISQRELPILVKFIDARENLSVQVHPGDRYAREHEGQNGKTEFWYVLDAKPGAQLIHGFAHPVTADQLIDSIQCGTLDKHLQKLSVHCGDMFYIPNGVVHAIGAGILLVEIQENSNVTYRLFDYDRIDADGKKRELHFEKAMDVLDTRPSSEIRQRPRTFHFEKSCFRELLCRCPYFEVERLRIGEIYTLSGLERSFQVLLCLNGQGNVHGAGQEGVCFSKGNCVFLPAGNEIYHLSGRFELIKIAC